MTGMTTILNGHLAARTTAVWIARGPAYRPHGHAGSGLAGTLLHSVARAFAWFTVRGLFEFFGLPLVLIGVVVIGLVWLHTRKRGDSE
jgi:hypothetical protein